MKFFKELTEGRPWVALLIYWATYMTKNELKMMRIPEGERFRFACHRGLSCFNSCCADVNIFLTPYDVLRIKRGLGIKSDEFIERYTVIIQGDEGLPYVLLKMTDDEDKTCPFVGDDGCSIYDDRPWSCRMYPIFPDTSKEGGYLLEKKSSCLGFNESVEWTAEEWKKDQGIEIYDKMNEVYKHITHHEFFNENKLDSDNFRLFFLACYDIDRFRKYVFESHFLQIYEIKDNTLQKIEEQDEELLNFGYRWIRFRIFSEQTIRVKDKEMDRIFHITGNLQI